MKNRNNVEEIYNFVSEKVSHYPKVISKMVQDKFGLSSRQGATYHLNQMIKKGLLESKGSGRNKTYYEIALDRWENKFSLAEKLDEHDVWIKIEEELALDLPDNVGYTLFYGFTEMLNNAKDHSEGNEVFVVIEVYRTRIKVGISDDGIGIFKKIQKAQNLADEKHSIIVLSKGKFTTDPENHSGEGIFFTSRAFDFFDIASDGLWFVHEKDTSYDWLIDQIDHRGTTVVMELCKTSDMDMSELFDEYTSDPEDPKFNQTIVPVKRLSSKSQVVSRSQGKRLMAGLSEFDVVSLDFDEIALIGQGFADEVFRVWVNRNPLIKLNYFNANAKVESMINHVSVKQASLDL